MTPIAPAPLELAVTGMTCASCAARIERKLNKLPGVTASVNYATEKATVALPSALTVQDAIATIEAAGYGAAPVAQQRERTPERRLIVRLLVSAVLALPVVVLSMAPLAQFPSWQWVALALAAPVTTWGAWPFHRAAFVNARHGAATMDTLVSLGVTAAMGWSLYALTLGGAGAIGMHMGFSWLGASHRIEPYLEVAAAVTVFLLAGRYAESRAKARSSAALTALLDLTAKTASLLEHGIEREVHASQIRVGDRFVVRPGEKVATDGVVIDGTSAVDTSLLTGEPVPVEVGPGAQVAGSVVNVGGRLVVEAVRVGGDTELARIARMVEQAQSGKAEVQRLADRVSAVFVPVVLALAAATLVVWLLATRDAQAAFTAAVATLIIACPCALGLATPTALLVGTGRGSQLGILLKGPAVLESTRRVDVVLLDKTGTVTVGRMALRDVIPGAETTKGELLARAAAAESGSEHPIGQAIRAAVATPPTAQEFAANAGSGVEASVEGQRVLVGRAHWLEQRGVVLDPHLLAASADASAKGLTTIDVAWNGAHHGVLALADTPRATSRQAVQRLRALQVRPILLTGDAEAVARAVATEVGIDEVVAGVLPAGKLEVVQRLQREGHVVAMVGDGVNDAAALAQADLGIAMGTGTDVAMEAGDITLVRADLLAAVDALRLARRTLATIKGNLFWAFVYNLAAIPLAMAGLLNPMIAGAAMAASSLFVVTNSLRLRRFKASGTTHPDAPPMDTPAASQLARA